MRSYSQRYFGTTQFDPRLRAGLAAYFIGSGSGRALCDYSGYGNDASFVDTPLWTSGLSDSRNAISLDGTNDYLQTPSSTTLDLSASAVSIAAWVWPINVGAQHIIVCKPAALGSSAAPVMAYGMGINDGNGSCSFSITTGGTRTQINSNANQVVYQTWNHISGTWDGTTMRGYINGVQYDSFSKSGTLNTYSTPLLIGAHGLPGDFAQGKIDELRVYNRFLSQAEIVTLAMPAFLPILSRQSTFYGNFAARRGDFFISGF